jgi:predicted dithiol-disulfide oxidoreductase (DUF899 family)
MEHLMAQHHKIVSSEQWIEARKQLDLTPKGRDEADQKPHAQAWVRRHDEYRD